MDSISNGETVRTGSCVSTTLRAFFGSTPGELRAHAGSGLPACRCSSALLQRFESSPLHWLRRFENPRERILEPLKIPEARENLGSPVSPLLEPLNRVRSRSDPG